MLLCVHYVHRRLYFFGKRDSATGRYKVSFGIVLPPYIFMVESMQLQMKGRTQEQRFTEESFRVDKEFFGSARDDLYKERDLLQVGEDKWKKAAAL